MINKTILTFLFFLIFGFYSVTNSYSNEGVLLGGGKTIEELKGAIKILDKKNIDFESNLNELNANMKLKLFLNKKLSFYELKTIKQLVKNYNINTKSLEQSILNTAKKGITISNTNRLLLEEKRTLYSGLIPFINYEFKKEYLKYVKMDADIFNKKNLNKTDLILEKELLNNKVESIENKIIAHKKFLKKNIEKLIKSKLSEKLLNLKKNENFKKLNNSSKIKVLDKTIMKIRSKLNILEGAKGVNKNIITKKRETYNMAINTLEEFKITFK